MFTYRLNIYGTTNDETTVEELKPILIKGLKEHGFNVSITSEDDTVIGVVIDYCRSFGNKSKYFYGLVSIDDKDLYAFICDKRKKILQSINPAYFGKFAIGRSVYDVKVLTDKPCIDITNEIDDTGNNYWEYPKVEEIVKPRLAKEGYGNLWKDISYDLKRSRVSTHQGVVEVLSKYIHPYDEDSDGDILG